MRDTPAMLFRFVRRKALLRTLSLSLTMSGVCGELQAPPQHDPDPPASSAAVPLVLEDVRVISMTSNNVLEHRTVVIENGLVAGVGDQSTPHPDGAVVIQGRGRYLMPALLDMHVHINGADLPAYLQAGITTVRNMWGWPSLPALVTQVEEGQRPGPRIISASQGLDAEPVQWPFTRVVLDPAQGITAVREQHQAGWRYLKVYTRLSRESYQAIMQEAAANDMTVVGHVPQAVPVEEAIALGQQSIEHLTGYDRRVSRAGRSGTWAWIDAEPSRYRNLAELSRQAGVWNCPTLAIFATLASQHSAEDRRTIVEERRRFVGELHRAGAMILAGSDAGIDVVAPGASLHQELAELVAAGLTPYAALRAATIDAGRFLEIASLGTLVVGAPADLLLVEENPLQDLSRLRRFSGLVQRGAWHPAASLQATSGNTR